MRSFADINRKMFFEAMMMFLEAIYDGPYNQKAIHNQRDQLIKKDHYENDNQNLFVVKETSISAKDNIPRPTKKIMTCCRICVIFPYFLYVHENLR